MAHHRARVGLARGGLVGAGRGTAGGGRPCDGLKARPVDDGLGLLRVKIWVLMGSNVMVG